MPDHTTFLSLIWNPMITTEIIQLPKMKRNNSDFIQETRFMLYWWINLDIKKKYVITTINYWRGRNCYNLPPYYLNGFLFAGAILAQGSKTLQQREYVVSLEWGIFKDIHSLSPNEIHLDVFVYKACQYPSVTKYFILRLTSSFVIEPCIVNESFPVCTQIGLKWTADAYV